MARSFEIFDGLVGQAPPIPEGSIVSRVILNNANLKVVLLGFAAEEELSEPIPAEPAILEVWNGEGLLTIGVERRGKDDDDQKDLDEPAEEIIEEVYEFGPGSWIYLDAGTPHTVQARSEMIILLTLLKNQEEE